MGATLAFRKYVAPEAVSYALDSATGRIQRQSAKARLEQQPVRTPAPPGQALKWWPVFAGMANSGDLGFTTGPFYGRGGQPSDSSSRSGASNRTAAGAGSGTTGPTQLSGPFPIPPFAFPTFQRPTSGRYRHVPRRNRSMRSNARSPTRRIPSDRARCCAISRLRRASWAPVPSRPLGRCSTRLSCSNGAPHSGTGQKAWNRRRVGISYSRMGSWTSCAMELPSSADTCGYGKGVVPDGPSCSRKSSSHPAHVLQERLPLHHLG